MLDGIVVGKYERAFTDTQFATLHGLVHPARHPAVVPKTGSPVDLANCDHRALLLCRSVTSAK
jgi:hypothetical protein